LFLIAAKVLSGLVSNVVEGGWLKGYNVIDELYVLLLQFANNTIFLSNGDSPLASHISYGA